MKFHIHHAEGGKLHLPARVLTVIALCVALATAAGLSDQSSTLTAKPSARPDLQKPHLAQLTSISPLPSEPTCTTTQANAWQTAIASQDVAAKTTSTSWLKANECVPVSVTQLPRPADQTINLGKVTWPDGKVLYERVTSHTIWNGIPGKVALTATQMQQFKQAATTPAAMLTYCCNNYTGALYRDSYWHCSANTFTSKFYDAWDELTWSMNTFAQYCTNYQVYGGVVENWDSRRGPINGGPGHFSWCVGYNTADGAFQACVPPMGQLGYYKQFPGDASKYGTFKILASEMVESQSAPMWDGTCFFGDVYHELHIHRNHVVGWEGDIASRGTGVQICKPPLWTYVP